MKIYQSWILYTSSCLFFYMKNKGVIKFITMRWGGGDTNLLLMAMGHISNVWSIKPNFKFKTSKCDQCGAFSDFVAGRIICTTCNTLGGGRVIIAVKIWQVYRCRGWVGGGHSFLGLWWCVNLRLTPSQRKCQHFEAEWVQNIHFLSINMCFLFPSFQV